MLGNNLSSVTLLQYVINSKVEKVQNKIEVDLRMSLGLSILTYFTSAACGREIILNGWKKAEVSGFLDGATTLPPEDPFEQIYID